MAGCSGEFEVKARVRIPPHQEVKVSSTRRALPYKSIPQLMHPTGLASLSIYQITHRFYESLFKPLTPFTPLIGLWHGLFSGT
jgi:hypothetical protein